MPNQRSSGLARIAKVYDRMRQLAKELHKSIIRKFKNRKVNSFYKDNIQSGDLADMQLISKCNTGFRFLLNFIDIYSISEPKQNIGEQR